MANLTVYAANTMLDGGPIPAILYVDLHTGDPTDAGTANLAAGSSRKAVTRTAAAAGTATNSNAPTWVPYTVNETISHVTFWDDPDAGQGNCWFVGALAAPKVVNTDDAVFIAAGAITIEMETY